MIVESSQQVKVNQPIFNFFCSNGIAKNNIPEEFKKQELPGKGRLTGKCHVPGT